MHEASKAAKRRGSVFQPISGKVLDIGCGPNPVSELYSGITEFKGWDLPDGDAQYLVGCKNNYWDCVHSSHSLEHMKDPIASLKRWVEVVSSGGYLVITVPDEEMYEHFQWPSRFNGDHKWSFTVHSSSRMPKSINVLDIIRKLKGIQLISLTRVEEGFDKNNPNDQTIGSAECCIEFILRKYTK
jgi:predicted SAM-dependent methyltransferase